MKTRNLAILLLSLVVFTNCFAQKGKKGKVDNVQNEVVTPPTPPTVPEVPVTTEECLVNISLFTESAKNKQYADALAPWNAAYTQCPGANKVIYSRGREIVQWELSQAKDDATYKKTFDKLMGMYDNRIKYFGSDEKYPTAWILGMKGLDYINFVKNDDLKKTGYNYLEQSIDGMKENTEVEVLRLFVITSSNIYKAEPAHGEKFIADYLKAGGYLDAIAKDSLNKNSQKAGDVKQGLDVVFVQSGVADVATLDKIYKDKVNENLTNAEFLTNVCSFYKKLRFTDSEVFFKQFHCTKFNHLQKLQMDALKCLLRKMTIRQRLNFTKKQQNFRLTTLKNLNISIKLLSCMPTLITTQDREKLPVMLLH